MRWTHSHTLAHGTPSLYMYLFTSFSRYTFNETKQVCNVTTSLFTKSFPHLPFFKQFVLEICTPIDPPKLTHEHTNLPMHVLNNLTHLWNNETGANLTFNSNSNLTIHTYIHVLLLFNTRYTCMQNRPIWWIPQQSHKHNLTPHN